jgi:hypothetical protein
VTVNREELAWAAGFFDGEGTVYLHHNRTERTGSWARLTVMQNDPQALARFQGAVYGLGTLHGPYTRSQPGRTNNPFWSLHAASWRDTQAIAALLWTWLSPVKRSQVRSVFARMKAERAKGGMSKQT